MASILVAGAGHGGLTAGALLAKAGHRVTVFEQGAEETLGHDWTDIFNPAAFREAGIPMPPHEEYEPACHMTFYGPSRRTGVPSYIRAEECSEVNMERRAILRHLVAFARGNGAELHFDAQVLRPLVESNRVVGLVVRYANGEQEQRCDLVIDAAGMHSAVRRQLPAELGIVKESAPGQTFSVYRAFYNDTGAKPLTDEPFSVYFFPLGAVAVCWVARENGYVDLLYGVFEENSREKAEALRSFLARELHPELGDRVLRGGAVRGVSVRRPISVMAADGYAAVGDSAGMTVPIIGSGICDSIRAGRILAETVLQSPAFTAGALWQYQVKYMREVGAVHASLDCFKTFLVGGGTENLDFLFDRGVMDCKTMIRARTGQEITYTLPELVRSGLRGRNRPGLLLQLAGVMRRSQALKRHCYRIPKEYDKVAVAKWAEKYDSIK
ncbi:MAG: NAD(P)/FAD-dependent oxidoreductase [Oscillospiraceae bacterium]|jgi:flavin-dependent dehydrogenase|nr:NAD(P)/FAD-dependent oxidoreductase [Oscillospiraceae bacterium]